MDGWLKALQVLAAILTPVMTLMITVVIWLYRSQVGRPMQEMQGMLKAFVEQVTAKFHDYDVRLAGNIPTHDACARNRAGCEKRQEDLEQGLMAHGEKVADQGSMLVRLEERVKTLERQAGREWDTDRRTGGY